MSDRRIRELERDERPVAALAARLRAGELSREALSLRALLGDALARAALGQGPPPSDLDEWALELDAHGVQVGLEAHVAVAAPALSACGSGRGRAERVLELARGWVAAEGLPPERRAEARWISARAMQEETFRAPPPTPTARWILRAAEVLEGGWAPLLRGAPDAIRALARPAVEAALLDRRGPIQAS